MQDFLAFRKFITPIVIQILFWIGVVVVVISGIVAIAQGGGVGPIIVGLLTIIIGPVLVRIYCELIILGFRMYAELQAINRNTAR